MVEQVFLYRAPSTVADADEVASWLEPRIEGSVAVRDRFLETYSSDTIVDAFAQARVRGPHERRTGNTMLGTLRYEERVLEHPERAGGIVYDGRQIQRALNDALDPAERTLETLHIVLLDRVLGTWGDHDGRWHKRVTVPGQPALLSVPGLYEAPAKPEAYYRAKQGHALLSGDTPPRELLERDTEGSFLIDNDPRTTAAVRGYALQAVAYLETGEAFCQDSTCCLFNAHTHEDLCKAQLEDPLLCTRHVRRYGRS